MNTMTNPFLSGKMPALFAKTALPLIVVMLVNGLYNLVDAYFLGEYVGEAALSAVTLVFPAQMLLFAFGTLFASGMASVLARNLGAGDFERGSQVFVNTHLMVLVLFSAIAGLFGLYGDSFIRVIVGDFPQLVDMSMSYISILIYTAPILGFLAVNTDALRSEGKLEFMSMIMVLSAIMNIILDYILIAKLGYGVAASAYATVLAQLLSLGLIVIYRVRGKSALKISFSGIANFRHDLGEVFPLGIPMSLGYIGISLAVGFINYNVLLWGGNEYQAIVGANGIVTRMMTFAILPLIGLNFAFQTIIGNNFGAKMFDRTNQATSFGLKLALGYSVVVQVLFIIMGVFNVGAVFVDSPNVIYHTSRILFYVSAGFFLFGPLMLVSGYFQAIGDAKNAIVLGLSKNYLFMFPLIFVLPYIDGEKGIWLAAPTSDLLVLVLTILILKKNSFKEGIRSGLYFEEAY